MKVFIGWSGETSQKVASILKSCLPILNPHIETLVSVDMERGAAWQSELSDVISSCDGALFCVTEENVNSTWLHYEAGLVSGQGKFVIPVLFDKSVRIIGPLNKFQSLTLEKNDLRRLAYDLNERCGSGAVSPEELDATFEGIYPTMEKMLAKARESELEHAREMREILEESRKSDERERAREYFEAALSLRQQAKDPQKQEFETLNSKLDAILSHIGMVDFGKAESRA